MSTAILSIAQYMLLSFVPQRVANIFIHVISKSTQHVQAGSVRIFQVGSVSLACQFNTFKSFPPHVVWLIVFEITRPSCFLSCVLRGVGDSLVTGHELAYVASSRPMKHPAHLCQDAHLHTYV